MNDCKGQAFCWSGEKAKIMGLNPNTPHADAEYSCGESSDQCPTLNNCFELEYDGAYEYCGGDCPLSHFNRPSYCRIC